MVTFKDKLYTFEEIEEKVKSGNIGDDKDFIVEALRSCFFTEDGMTVVDEKGITIMANGAHRKIMGIDGKEIVGKNTKDLVTEGIFQKSASATVFESKQQETITQNLSNGKTILVTATPIFDEEGNIKRIINNLRDVPILNALFEEQLKQETLIDTYRSELSKHNNIAHKGLIAESSEMRRVLEIAERAAMNDSIVLILGESGVGKGVIARLIHDMSKRSSKHMVSINCGAIPESLLESELFGYAPGAFTGASREGKMGLFEAADDGVVFLDEIGELPLNLQPKLLSFLETGEIMRVGSTRVKKVNCRIIAATNRELKDMVDRNQFREDLYYRLSVIPIKIPPLRERREDIIPLTITFLKEINEKNGMNKTISQEVLEVLKKAEWKGNVRELRNAIERYVVLSLNQEITLADLPKEDAFGQTKGCVSTKKLPVCLPELVAEMEDEYIALAMKKGGSIRKAAKLLNVSPTTLFRKINRE